VFQIAITFTTVMSVIAVIDSSPQLVALKSNQVKRWHIYAAVGIVGLLSAWGIRHAFSQRAQRHREVEYRKVLLTYSQVLKAGMTRKQVEDYLSSQHVPFRQMCCITAKELSGGVFDHAYDDLVKIGQEDSPWFCSENNVYVAFQFFGSKPQALPEAALSDTLRDVSLHQWLEGCL